MNATTFALSWSQTLRRLLLLALVVAGLTYVSPSPWPVLLPVLLVAAAVVPRFLKASRRGILAVDDRGVQSPFFGLIRWGELEDVQLVSSSDAANSVTRRLALGDRFLFGLFFKAAGLEQLAFSLRKPEAYLARLRQPSRLLMRYYMKRNHGGPTLDLGLVAARPDDVEAAVQQHWRACQNSNVA